MPAALSVGSTLGGLLYGRRTWPGGTTAQLAAAAGGFAAGWLPLLADPAPAAAVTCAALPGLFLAPLLAAAFTTVDALAPAEESTEASAWLIASIGLGQAAGAALTSATGPPAVAVIPLTGAVAAVALVHRCRRLLAPDP
jgi:hypothetical protein